MYDAKFQRVEEKYLLTKEEKEKFLKMTKKHLEKDKYFYSEIHNIYFDTRNNDLIINSLEKPVFKDKFRIRSYNKPTLEDDIFFEMKTKYKGIVGKRRVKLKLKDFNAYLNNKYFLDTQIFKELDYYFKYYDLVPAIYIAYDRNSYQGIENKDLRITFDSNLRSRRKDLEFTKNTKLVSYFKEDYYIMEIKTNYTMPLWLVKTISTLKLKPVSFSKYGKIYEKEKKEMLTYA